MVMFIYFPGSSVYVSCLFFCQAVRFSFFFLLDYFVGTVYIFIITPLPMREIERGQLLEPRRQSVNFRGGRVRALLNPGSERKKFILASLLPVICRKPEMRGTL